MKTRVGQIIRQRKKREEKMSKGLCAYIGCNNRSEENKTLCKKHLKYHIDYHKKHHRIL